ncbi:uncharacterized protein JCM10292_002972 [Rhodotorula paludigena]|uniref:uncharacterized protein n=1 Tax=Rhodotorula paludigena TaxID=86838 RepID=UPI003172D8A2
MPSPTRSPAAADPASETAGGGPLAPTPSSSKHPSLAPAPSLPSTFSSARAQHARRPSRAERYEAIVSTARDVLQRGSTGPSRLSREYDGGVGLGLSQSSPPTRRDAERRRSRLEDDAGPGAKVDEREWQDAVRSLLKVVDGMTQQLATHDDLAAQLKIAQSNLTLAEVHSEFLEESLRRRDSRSSNSQNMVRHLSGTAIAPPPMPQGRRGSGDAATDSGSSGGLFGLGLGGDGEASGAKAFFRLPSKRKPVASNTSASTTPGNNLSANQSLRSLSSSPLLNDTSPNPAASPSAPPRLSTSTSSSVDENASPQLSAEVFTLQSQVSSLENECAALRSNNTSLKRSNETLVGKCAELEKTKEDLMSELENLSVELFSEANALVADERKARAAAEAEIADLRTEIEALNSQLAILRQVIASRSAAAAAAPDETSPDLPSLPHSAPTTPLMASSGTLQPYSASPARMASPAQTAPDGHDRPVSVASVGSTSSGRKWFSFSRAASQTGPHEPPKPAAPARAASHPAPPGTLQPPAMARGDSGSSYLSDASATSFFSTLSGPATSSASTYERSPSLSAGRTSFETDGRGAHQPVAGSSKGRDKARELDLGIHVPPTQHQHPSLPRKQSEGERTIGARTPVTARSQHADLMAAQQHPLPPSPLHAPVGLPNPPVVRPASSHASDGQPPHAVSSPPLPPLPPSTPMPSAYSAPGPDDATPVPDKSPATFAGPTPRPARAGASGGARPLAMHLNVTPPTLSSAFFQSASDPSAVLGGPSAAQMTAASKSPKSPNELRWKELAGSLGNLPPSSAGAGAAGQQRSRSASRGSGADGEGRRVLPPSPALPNGFHHQQQQAMPPPPAPSAQKPVPEPSSKPRSTAPEHPPVPVAKAAAPVPITARLRLDTSSSGLSPSAASGGAPRLGSARPAAPSPMLAPPRPGLTRAQSSNSVPFPPYSTAQAAAASGPASAAPAAYQQSSRPPYARAETTSSFTARPQQHYASGLTPSTSASSLASRSSSGHGHGLGGGGGRALSPDGTRAVEDLESLMQSIVEMSEGMFDEGGAGRAVPPVQRSQGR